MVNFCKGWVNGRCHETIYLSIVKIHRYLHKHTRMGNKMILNSLESKTCIFISIPHLLQFPPPPLEVSIYGFEFPFAQIDRTQGIVS